VNAPDTRVRPPARTHRYRRMLAISPDNSAAAVDYGSMLVACRRDFDRALVVSAAPARQGI
jgi:hypothetical protein